MAVRISSETGQLCTQSIVETSEKLPPKSLPRCRASAVKIFAFFSISDLLWSEKSMKQ